VDRRSACMSRHVEVVAKRRVLIYLIRARFVD
jgi:hypothetical protein